MAKKAPKVAYVVFEGRVPGVYRTWAEAEAQVSRYRGAKHQGYTDADGGRAKAEEDFMRYTQLEAVTGNSNASAGGGGTKDASPASVRPQSPYSHIGPSTKQRTEQPCQYIDLTYEGHERSCDPKPNFLRTPLSERSVSHTNITDEPAGTRKSGLEEQETGPAASSTQKKRQCSASGDVDYGVYAEVPRDGYGVKRRRRDGYASRPLGDLGPAPDHMSFPSHSEDGFSDGGTASECNMIDDSSQAPPSEPDLCEEQANLVNLIASGKNVFYTGSAGCGKSTVLKAFVKRLEEAGKHVKIIAPTGQAAVNIDGSTSWSFAGWNQDSMKKPITELEHNAWKFERVKERLCATDVLVIDEVSMMENHHFERLNRVMKSVRTNPAAPFGGVQLVVTGDFCQLPPVKPFEFCMECGFPLSESKDRQIYSCTNVKKQHGPFLDVDKWAFRSAAWKECRFEHVNLTKIHRQSNRDFITILQKMRFGRPLSAGDKNVLLNHRSDTTDAVRLFPLLKQAETVNNTEFGRLKGPTISFTCLDSCHREKAHGNLNFDRNIGNNSLVCQDRHRFERQVHLKRHMLVILVVNLDLNQGLINGAQGVIVGFLDHQPLQIPEQFGKRAEFKKAEIKQFMKGAKTKKLPLVRFRNGTKTIERLIEPYCTMNELGESKPYSWVTRTQIPLLPAWAISIHKSQGMTLSRVEVNLSRSFEQGQNYVALSRATSLQGLKVQALDDCNWGGNAQVMEFLRKNFGNDLE